MTSSTSPKMPQTREIQNIGGTEALDEPYMKIAMSRMIRKRAGWLTALFIWRNAHATAMGMFEHEIERVVALALFIPLIISSGGNSGSQAATLVISRTGSRRGASCGLVAHRAARTRSRSGVGSDPGRDRNCANHNHERPVSKILWRPMVFAGNDRWVCVGGSCAVGSLIGSIMPMVLQRLGYDPAVSSAPFVATLVDVTGLIIYFTVALIVFGSKMAPV